MPQTHQRVQYLDAIKVLLVMLVIAHHSAITYGASGSWYYQDPRSDLLTKALLTIFTAVNQSFFMGLFFFISSYFLLPSLIRKGPLLYVRDRLVRLGMPILVFAFALNPIVVYLATGPHVSLPAFFAQQVLTLQMLGIGPLWFLEALLLMSLLTVACYALRPHWFAFPHDPRPMPGHVAIAVYAILSGLASFAVRIAFPVGVTIANLQLAYFPQYVSLFVFGLMAYRNSWLSVLSADTSRLWFRISIVAIVLTPVLLITGAQGSNLNAFFGGWHWQALAYAIWEPFVCVGLCMKFITVARSVAALPRSWVRALSPNAFTAYIVHPLVIVLIAVLLRQSTLYGLLKFAILVASGIAVTFSLSAIIRGVPRLLRLSSSGVAASP